MICPHCKEYTSFRYKNCPMCKVPLPMPKVPEHAPSRPGPGQVPVPAGI